MRKLTTKHDDMWLIMHIEVHLLHGVGPKIFAESATTDRSNFQRLAGSVTIDRNNWQGGQWVQGSILAPIELLPNLLIGENCSYKSLPTLPIFLGPPHVLKIAISIMRIIKIPPLYVSGTPILNSIHCIFTHPLKCVPPLCDKRSLPSPNWRCSWHIGSHSLSWCLHILWCV